MRINVTQPILDYEGKPITTPEFKDGKQSGERGFTLRDAIVMALNNPVKDETLLAEQKAKIFAITNKVYADKEIKLTVDESAFIKERAGKVDLSALVYGRIVEVLDGDGAKTTDGASTPA
jgi:hypothetical protein